MSWFARQKSWILPLLVIVLALLVFSFLKATKTERIKPEVVERAWPVEVLQVEIASYQPTQELYGKVRSKQQIKFVAPIAAEVAKIYKFAGESFQAGDLLLELNPTEIEIAVQLAKADLIEAQAGLVLEQQAQQTEKSRYQQEQQLLEIRRKDYQRNQDLLARNLVSEAQLEQAKDGLNRQELAVLNAKLALEQQQAKLSQVEAKKLRAQAKYDQAQLDAERAKIQPDFAGVIANLQVAQGDKLNANSLILEAFPNGSLEVVASLPNRVLAQAQQALQASLQATKPDNQAWLLLGSAKYPLQLSRLSGEATAAGLDAIFQLPPELNLRPGEQVLIQFKLPAIEAVAIPYSAIYGFDKVYLIDQNRRLQARKVQQLGAVEINQQKWLLVTGDLNSGDQLLTTHLPNAIQGLLVNFDG